MRHATAVLGLVQRTVTHVLSDTTATMASANVRQLLNLHCLPLFKIMKHLCLIMLCERHYLKLSLALHQTSAYSRGLNVSSTINFVLGNKLNER